MGRVASGIQSRADSRVVNKSKQKLQLVFLPGADLTSSAKLFFSL